MTPIPPTGPSPRRRRRWPWIIAGSFLGVFILLVVIGSLVPKPRAASTSATSTTPPLPSSPTPPAAARVSAMVTEVVDGDTIKVDAAAPAGAVTVRILGIDAPETKKPGYTVGCYGPEASAHTAAVLRGQTVTLTRDDTQDPTDKYGRTLAYVELPGGGDYSVDAARGGFARSYVYDNKPVGKHTAITAAEDQAKQAGAGLWGPPGLGRTDSVPIPSTTSPAPTTPPASSSSPPPAPPAPPSAPPAPTAPPSTFAPPRATTPPAAPAPPRQQPTPGANVSYLNCAAARAAGAAPLYHGSPGYSSKLDADGDGIACE